MERSDRWMVRSAQALILGLLVVVTGCSSNVGGENATKPLGTSSPDSVGATTTATTASQPSTGSLTGTVDTSFVPAGPQATTTGSTNLVLHAEDLYRQYGAVVAREIGADTLPTVTFEVTHNVTPEVASTLGGHITLNATWFEKSDDGAIIHEIAHAVQNYPANPPGSSWLAEGIADYVRDRLGFQTSWSYPHYERGGERSGYQTSAHFLFWLEGRRPGGIRELSRALSRGAYTAGLFGTIYGSSLDDLIAQYDAAQG